jgi:hypothetical protein
MALMSRKEAINDVRKYDPRNQYVNYKYREKKGTYRFGDTIDYVYCFEGDENDYKHMIEKITGSDGFKFRFTYATVFHIEKGYTKAEQKHTYYRNLGGQTSSSPHEESLYYMLLTAFSKPDFFDKKFKKKVLKCLLKQNL